MHFGKLQVGVFFAIMIAIGWLIYPREFFLGYISEGTPAGLKQAEAYYRRYLDYKPSDKKVTLRLADLYSRLDEPAKATPLLEELTRKRTYDWEVAMRYIDHLDELHEQEEAYKARLEIAERFLKAPKPNKPALENLLGWAYHYARYKQKSEAELYSILTSLMKVSERPRDYKSEISALDWAFKKESKLSSQLMQRLILNPAHVDNRLELAGVWAVQGKLEKALKLLDEGLLINRQVFEFYRMKLLLHEKMGLRSEMIADIDGALQTNPPDDQKLMLLGQKASLYAEMKRHDEALALYRLILKKDPTHRDNWLNVFYMLSDLKRTDEALALAADYLSRFRDGVIEEAVVGLYLYEKKDLSRLDYYRAMMVKHRQKQWAVDVGWLLAEANPHGAAAWFESVIPLFPGVEDLETSLLSTLVMADEKSRALERGQAFLQKHPSHFEVMVSVAGLLAESGLNDEAAALFEKWLTRAGRTAANLKRAGLSLLFADDATRGRDYLAQSLEKNDGDIEAHFWMAEALTALEDRSRAKHEARRVLELLKPKTRLILQEKRWRLKAQARLHYEPAVVEGYEALIKSHPRDLEVRSDYLDVLLEQKEYAKARIVLSTTTVSTPDEQDRLEAYRARLALATRDYHRALKLYEDIISRHPGTYQKDLAETWAGLGDGRKAVTLYQNYLSQHAGLKADRHRLRELRRQWDDQVSNFFSWKDFGADSIWEWASRGYYSFRKNWWVSGTQTTGRYQSPGIGLDDVATRALVGVKYAGTGKLTAEMLAGGGFSPTRRTPSFKADLKYKIAEGYEVSAGGYYRLLRDDIPSAIGQGDLQDQASLGLVLTPWPQVSAGLRYEFSRDYLPNGGLSFGHLFEPTLSLAILQKPAVSLGYQFTLAHQSDKKGFLTQVALLPDVRAHYVTLSASGNVTRHLSADAAFFAGEDTARNLHLFEGDLWGFRLHALWEVKAWLDLEAGFDYGRETLGQVGGKSQQVMLGVKGHWN